MAQDLKDQLQSAKRKNVLIGIHKAADQNQLGMKAWVTKLTGDAKNKFELDHKLSSDQFARLVMKLSTQEEFN